MEASRDLQRPRQYFQAHPSSYKHAQFGMYMQYDLDYGRSDMVLSIFRPAKPATQSGDWHRYTWRMDWDPLQKGHRWENPLMGWQSSADFMQGTHLNFKTKEEAIRFANKQGYEYFVQEPNERKFAPKAYADQFVWSGKPLKQVRTK